MNNNSKNMVLSISKQELSMLPSESFKGNILVINNPIEAEKAINTLYKSNEIGFDTETRPSFKKGVVNSVSLIQLADHNNCFLFRINKLGLIPCIQNLLEDDKITKIGLSLRDDFLNLNRIFKISPAGFIDLQDYVRQYNIVDTSLSKIYAILFGKRISKSQRLSNWEAENLTDAQKAYASLDAEACLKIYDFLREGKFDKNSSNYLHPYEELFPPVEKNP